MLLLGPPLARSDAVTFKKWRKRWFILDKPNKILRILDDQQVRAPLSSACRRAGAAPPCTPRKTPVLPPPSRARCVALPPASAGSRVASRRSASSGNGEGAVEVRALCLCGVGSMNRAAGPDPAHGRAN